MLEYAENECQETKEEADSIQSKICFDSPQSMASISNHSANKLALDKLASPLEKSPLASEWNGKSSTIADLARILESRDVEIEQLRKQKLHGSASIRAKLVDVIMKQRSLKDGRDSLSTEIHSQFLDMLGWWETVSSQIQTLVSSNHDQSAKYSEILSRYLEEAKERRSLYNRLQELRGNIRVFCRVRPMKSSEESSGFNCVVDFDDFNFEQLNLHTERGTRPFKFDHVFRPSAGQEEVFETAAPVITSVLDGYNVCIFAYGQTGTGKTFTMEGSVSQRGVNYRTLQALFASAELRKAVYKFELSVSVLEIYNEQIRDLLVPNSKNLEIKIGSEGGHYVADLTERKVTNVAEVWEILQKGSNHRSMGSTQCNEHSSRSHCMLCVTVKSWNHSNSERQTSKLWLIDLAGSERVGKSEVEGERLKEAMNINKSLSALGDVIFALSNKSSHVPYRNSKLTHLLQDSLGGDAKTLMFCQISPSESDASETLCSLQFASRVKGVELGPHKKNNDAQEAHRYKQQAEKCRFELKIKEDALKRSENHLQIMESKMKAKEQTIHALNDKVQDISIQLAREKKARSSAESELQEKLNTIRQFQKKTAGMHHHPSVGHHSSKSLVQRENREHKEKRFGAEREQASMWDVQLKENMSLSDVVFTSPVFQNAQQNQQQEDQEQHQEVELEEDHENNMVVWKDGKAGLGNEEVGDPNRERKSELTRMNSRLSLSGLPLFPTNKEMQGEKPFSGLRRLSLAANPTSLQTNRSSMRSSVLASLPVNQMQLHADSQSTGLFTFSSKQSMEGEGMKLHAKSFQDDENHPPFPSSIAIPHPRRLSMRQKSSSDRRSSIFGGSSFMGPGRKQLSTVKEDVSKEEEDESLRRKRRRGEEEKVISSGLPPLDPSLHGSAIKGGFKPRMPQRVKVGKRSNKQLPALMNSATKFGFRSSPSR